MDKSYYGREEAYISEPYSKNHSIEYICIYVHTYAYMHICGTLKKKTALHIYVYMCIRMHICIHVGTYVGPHIGIFFKPFMHPSPVT